MKTLTAIMILVALIIVFGFGKLAAQQSTDPGASNGKPNDQMRVIRSWTGMFSPMWNNANNWTPIGIPTPADDVVIGGALNMPMINSPGAYCHSLVNNAGMVLMITPPGTLHVFGQVDNYGNIDMHNQMTVDTNLNLHPGGMLNTANPTALLTVMGDCYLASGSQMMMIAGSFIMSGNGSGTFTSLGGACSFFDVFLNKTGTITFSSSSVTPVSITGNLTVASGTTCNIEMTPDIVLSGNLLVNSGGNLRGLQGRVCFNGGSTIFQTINFSNTGSYFNHLRVLGGVSLLNNIQVNGNIYLDGGNFSPGMYTVYLKGNWNNNAGPSAFTKGSSRVTFNGPADQTIILSLASTYPVEEFHILEVSKTTGTLLLNQPGQVVICDSYDWSAGMVTVVEGTLTINSLADVCITGKFVVHSNGSVSITSTGSVSFDCDLYIYGGTVHVYGGTADSQWPGSSPGSITMSDGLLYFHDVGVVVNNLFSFTENISGGTIRVNGGFYIGRPDFHPSGGTIEFVGSNPATIGMVDGVCFYNVLVNKAVPPPPSPVLREPSRDTTLYSASDLDIQGSLGVESGSGLDLDHYVDVYGPATVSGSVWVRMPGSGVPSVDLHNGVDIEIGSHWELVAFVWVKVEGPVPYPAQDVDGEIDIDEDAKWESCSAPINVGPTGSIVFTTGGGGGSGKVVCPGFVATYPGTFISNIGTLELTGSMVQPSYLNLTAGNHCCNLLINSLGPIVLQNDCDVLGDLDILQGSLDVSTANFDINLHGSWTDEIAPTGFEARNGTVSFLGSGSSDIDAGGEEESFFDVIINKSGGTVTAYGINGTLHVCGDLDVHVDSFFDIYTEITIDGDLDLGGDLRDNDCDVVIHGYPHLATGSEIWITGASGRVLCDAPSLALPPLNIAGYVWIQDGTLEVTQMPVSVASSGNVYFLGGGGGSGGCIKCPSFQALTPGTFVPDCGTLELTGTAPTSTHYLNIGPGNHTHDLLVNDWLVVLQNDCDIYGDLHIQQGILDVSPSNYAINLRGSWTNDVAPTGFEARNGTVNMLGGGNVYINAGGLREEYYNLNIAKSGGGRVNTNCELQINGSLTDMPDSFFDVFFDIDIMQDAVTQGYIVIHGSATVLVFGSYDTTPTHHLTVVNGGHLVLNAVSAAEVEEEGEVVMEQGSLWESNAPLCVTSTGSIAFTDGGGGGSGACIACPGFTALTPGSFVPAQGTLEITSALGAWPQHLNIGPGNHAFNLVINSSGPVSLDNDCDIYGDLHIMPESFFDVFFDVFVAGDLDLLGELEVEPGVEVEIGHDLTDEPGSSLNVGNGGGVRYGFGSMNQIITQIRGEIYIEGSGTLRTNHDLVVMPTGEIIIAGGGGGGSGGVICRSFEALTPGTYIPTTGFLEIDGSSADSPQYVNIAPGNNAHDLIISSTGLVSCQNDCDILGDLDILPESFFDVFFDISIAGDLDLAGEMELENNVHASVSGLPTLGVASVLIVRMSADIVTNDLLQTMPPLYAQGLIIISDGEFIANQALVVPATGSIQFTDGGGGGGSGKLSCRGIEALTPGSFAPQMGILEITGTPTASAVHINLGIGNKAFNLLVNTPITAVLSNDLVVDGDLDIDQGNLDVSTGNYNIYVWGSWATNNPTSGFIARDASVHFVGSGTCGISTVKDHEEFHNLIINHAGTVTLYDNVSTMGDGYCDVLLGTLYVNNVLLSVSGDCTIGNGGMLFLDGGECALGDGRVLTVSSGGTCKAHGNRNRDSKMKGKDESYWKMHVGSGGHVSAKQTEFKHLREEGVKVYPGGSIDPDNDFDECKFNSGAPGSTYLTIDNSQSLTIDNIEFVSSSGELHNIAKEENAGHILVASSSGNFAGPDHEYDPYNLVDWTGFYPNLVITQFYASNYDPYVCDPVTYHVQVTNQSAVVIITAINLRLINPATGEYEDHWIYGMLGWGVVEVDFTDSSNEPGYEIKEVWVDPDNLIQESNEADNTAYLPEPVEWHSLPAVGNIDITRLTDSQGRLTWDYPIWASRYKIYTCGSPDGTYSYLGHTVDSFFDVFLDDPMLFYKVTAERDDPPAK